MTQSPYGYAARFANVVARQGAPVILRKETRTSGPTPQLNPPRVAGAAINGAVAAGATAVALSAISAVGRLLAGDILLAAGVQLVVTAVAAAAPAMTPGFAAVTIAPAPVAIPNATPVLFSFAADQPTYAMIEAFPVRLIDGERIRASDLQVKIAAYGLPDEIPADWSVIVGSREMEIVVAVPTYMRGEVISFDIQARL